MKRKGPTVIQVVDYSAARDHAIRWLGDRYLLARPINGSRYGSRPPVPGVARAADDAASDLQPLTNH